mmetsp:Transcript_47546/g.101726  ORF Transcript_47546/g.101726 Transcript_47546/m.101726 type:complete len:86 (-) Transcript_47546:1494-1751(-)
MVAERAKAVEKVEAKGKVMEEIEEIEETEAEVDGIPGTMMAVARVAATIDGIRTSMAKKEVGLELGTTTEVTKIREEDDQLPFRN